MSRLINIIIVLVIGLIGGGYSAWYSVQDNHGFGALRIGQWIAWPLAGNVDADPYTEAKVAREGTAPLGAAEGLAFHARLDTDGNPLQRQCRYEISGTTPPARVWTLSAIDEDQHPVPALPGAENTAYSQSMLRRANGSFVVTTGPQAVPGNWVSTTGRGPYSLVLRLYDTPVTGTTELFDPSMPTIRKVGCPQ